MDVTAEAVEADCWRADHRVDDEAMTAVACADLLAEAVTAQRRVGARRLALAVRWADLHHPDQAVPDDATGYSRRARCIRRQLGSEGTPEVSEFAAVELGMLLQTTTRSAEVLLRDALDLRHRLPAVWDAVMCGLVDDWKARRAAVLVQPLAEADCRGVDADILDALLGLPFGRAMAVVEAKVIAADPAAYESRRRGHAQERYVSTGAASDAHGLRTLVARSEAGDIARLEAMVSHLATLVAPSDQALTAQDRRAKALALLASPALACLALVTGHVPTAEDTDGASAVELGVGLGRALVAAAEDVIGEDVIGEAVRGEAVPGEAGADRGRSRRGLRWLTDRLRNRSVLYLHVAGEAIEGQVGCQVGRVEAVPGAGPLGVEQLKEWVGHDRVTVRPVLDLGDLHSVDAYEVPARMREALMLRHPVEVFPFGTLASRVADVDHTEPFRPGDRGQTRLDNLGPLSRRHHRAKTFGGFEHRQPKEGVYLWRTPTGHWFRVDPRGTQALGRVCPEEGARIEPVASPRLDVARPDLSVEWAA